MDSPRALFETFEATARAHPGRPLLAIHGAGGVALTGRDLLRAARETSAELAAAGLGAGSLALVSAPGAAFVVGLLAVWQRGGAVLAADAGAPQAELDAIASAFATGVRLTAREAGAPPRVSRPGKSARGGPALPPGSAIVRLTSGSTGRPRGIAVTADQLLADAAHIVEGMRVTPEDTNVGAIPLAHAYGMDSLVMPMLVQGSPLLLAPSPLAAPLGGALSLERPLVFPGVPYLYELLLKASEGGAPVLRPRGLRTCISAAAPLAPATAAAFRDRCGVPIRAFYGASEVGAIAFDASPEGDAAVAVEGCVGTPLPGVAIDLTEGERRVAVRGAAVASGYVGPPGGGDEEGAAGRFEGGAFVAADTGLFLERAGRVELRLTGRAGTLLNVSGRKVNPCEVEEALRSLEGVRAAAVLPEPDGARGQALAACLVAGPDVTRGRVLSHLRARLAPHKLPRRILFLEAMPLTPRGKRDEAALRRALQGAATEE